MTRELRYKCDRCGTIFGEDVKSHLTATYLKGLAIVFKENFDFCTSCAESFRKWWETK